MNAMAAGSEGRVVLAGSSWGFWAEENLGIQDFTAVMLDTSTLATQSPTAAPQTAHSFAPTANSVDADHTPAPATFTSSERPTSSPIETFSPAISNPAPASSPADTASPTASSPDALAEATTPPTLLSASPSPITLPEDGGLPANATADGGPASSKAITTPIVAGVVSACAAVGLLAVALRAVRRRRQRRLADSSEDEDSGWF